MEIRVEPMNSSRRWLMVGLACVALLILIALVRLQSVAAQGMTGDGYAKNPAVEPTPGLVVYGYVRRIGGEGVEGVNIYRSLDGYPGDLVATTDASGYYQSDFTYIWADEMITVWAVGGWGEMEPMRYYWRHYTSIEWHRCDFINHLHWLVYVPLIAR